MAKLWGGRFQKDTDALVNDFNESISFDRRLYQQDIAGSKAHAAMLFWRISRRGKWNFPQTPRIST